MNLCKGALKQEGVTALNITEYHSPSKEAPGGKGKETGELSTCMNSATRWKKQGIKTLNERITVRLKQVSPNITYFRETNIFKIKAFITKPL